MQLPEALPKRIKLTQLEADLVTFLSTLIEHVRSRDGNGNESKLFCLGCEKNRTHPCVLPVIEPYLEELESRRIEGVLLPIDPKDCVPGGIINPPRTTVRPSGKYRTRLMVRTGGKIKGSTVVFHDEERLPDDAYLKAIIALTPWIGHPLPPTEEKTLEETIKEYEAIGVRFYPGKSKLVEGSANG